MELLPGFVDPLPPGARPGPGDDGAPPRYRDALREVASLAGKLPRPRRSGRGIVYVGGGPYWPGVAVGVRLLRESGCTLPVEVWYRGECEAVYPEDVEGLGVRLVDLDAMQRERGDARVPRGNAKTGGWEAKLYALTHTQWEQVLFLDADAYAVEDPTPILDLICARRFAFWEDHAGAGRHINWRVVWPAGDSGVVPIQGGQLGLHVRDCWAELVTCHWICQHSDWYFRYAFGDQDAWRIAFAATGGGHYRIGPTRWPHKAMVADLGGKPMIVHRITGKLFAPEHLPEGGSDWVWPDHGLPLEGRVYDLLSEVLNRRGVTAGERFGAIYRRRIWGDGSGWGGNEEQARPYADLVNALAAAAGWRSCVDLGCGDGRAAELLHVRDYTGVDCVAEVAAATRARLGRRILALDAIADPDALPAADVLLCRDVLHHWPSAEVRRFLAWLFASRKYAWALLTQDRHQAHDGADTYLGGYRPLDPGLAPLNEFPRPNAVVTQAHKCALLYDLRKPLGVVT